MLDIVPEGVLGHTAFMLLSSSSANHYIQSAIAAGPSSRIENNLDLGIMTHEELVEHASSLWSTIVHSTKRDVPEVELAILLPILARVAADSEETRRLIRSISVHDEVPAIWLSALARKLWRQMPSDTSYDSGNIMIFIYSNLSSEY
jgi:hypothetical protein